MATERGLVSVFTEITRWFSTKRGFSDLMVNAIAGIIGSAEALPILCVSDFCE